MNCIICDSPYTPFFIEIFYWKNPLDQVMGEIGPVNYHNAVIVDFLLNSQTPF